MTGGYTVIIGLLLYILIVPQLSSRYINPIKAATILMTIYFVLSSLILGLVLTAQGVPVLINLFNLHTIGIAFLQFVTAVFIFYKIEEDEDSAVAYLLWGGLGIALIFFIIPPVVLQLR